MRIGQDEGRNRRAVKVWDQREFRNLDDAVELGTRNIKLALRRLRRFAREGADRRTRPAAARSAPPPQRGWLDLQMRPERHNAVKLLMFLDVGGSMDDHVGSVEELFSAARAEFKHLEYFYFHNCLYEGGLEGQSRRRHAEQTDVWKSCAPTAPTTGSCFVGDASMSPYEIDQAGRQRRALERGGGPSVAAPPARRLSARRSGSTRCPRSTGVARQIGMIRQIMDDRMFPLTLEGIDRAMRRLTR